MNWEICDLHSHILPGMDDGCKTAEQSVEALKLAYSQGVRYLFATPHYYPVESVESFLRRREAAWDSLQKQMEKEPAAKIPRICLGAEVAFRPGLSFEEDLHKLCLGNSRYLLLEMPFNKWSSGVIREVTNICNARSLVPVIAHVERYIEDQSAEAVRELFSSEILAQMNAGSLQNIWTRRQRLKLLRKGTVQLLGSDCHNLTTRPPNMEGAVAFLEKTGQKEILEEIAFWSDKICREAFEI